MYGHVGGVVSQNCASVGRLAKTDTHKNFIIILYKLQNLVSLILGGTDGTTSTDGITLLQELSVIHPTLVLST